MKILNLKFLASELGKSKDKVFVSASLGQLSDKWLKRTFSSQLKSKCFQARDDRRAKFVLPLSKFVGTHQNHLKKYEVIVDYEQNCAKIFEHFQPLLRSNVEAAENHER